MHYFQFNIGDYVSSTQHLDETEDLAYRRMLDIYYSKELPLPEDQKEIGRLIRMRTHSESIATVLKEFFTLEKDGYHCQRADIEILAFQAKSEKARKSAEIRWGKIKDLDDNKADANALRTQCEGNAKHKTINTKHKTNKDRSSLVNDSFAYWWDFYPSSRRKNKTGCFNKYKAKCSKLSDDEIIELSNTIALDVMKRAKDLGEEIKFMPMTEPYLNQERWMDEK